MAINSIPASYIVQVNPSVLTAAGAAIDLNGLLLTQNGALPIDTLQPFASLGDVETFFGVTSPEAQAAAVYFGGYAGATALPGQLLMAQYNAADVPAYTRGASLAGVSLAQLQAVTGDLSVTIDGVIAAAASVDLSAVTSFTQAASVLSTALSALVTFDVQRQALVITSATTGAASTISYATGAAADALLLSQATGAVLSQGAAAATPGAFMENIVTNLGVNWALVTTLWEAASADKLAFSDWANARAPRYAYVGWDTDALARQSGETQSWGYTVQYRKYEGTVPIHGTLAHAMFVLGFAASLDFNRLNGRATLAFRYQGGLTPYVTNQTDAAVLEAKGYNFFGSYATAKDTFNFMYAGAISGSWKWLDSYLNQIWLCANLQLAMITLLTSGNSLPYNDQGYELVRASCLDPISKAVNFGAIRTGIALSDSQKQQMQFALGIDVSNTLYSAGYYLQITPATADIRAARASPSMTLYYTDGGSIERLTLASIEVM